MTDIKSSDSEEDEEKKESDELPRRDSLDTSTDEDEGTQDVETQDDAETRDVKPTDKMAKMPSVLSILPPMPRRKRFIPKYEIEGVQKVELGDETQLQIEMLIGTHVYAQAPWKTVSKSKLIENIETNGEKSELYFIRKEITEYPEEELLMGYIIDESKDTDEFYICLTPEAKDHCKQQSDKFLRRQEKKLLKSIYRKPRPWVSLGSEDEITSILPVTTRPLMEVELKAKYPTEYDPEMFTIRDANAVRDGYIELTPYRQRFNCVIKRRIDAGIQVSPFKVTCEVQTVLRYPQNMWTQTITDQLGNAAADLLGGGDFEAMKKGKKVKKTTDADKVSSKSVSSSSETDTTEDGSEAELLENDAGLVNYKAAIMRTRRPSYIKKINNFVTATKDELEDIVELNTVMDIYRNDYPELQTKETTEIYKSMIFEEYICFTDVRAKDKCISAAIFHPMWSGVVAICYSDGSPKLMKTVTTRSDPVQRAVYGINPVLIWSHVDSLLPKLFLNSPREVKSLAFCPFDENLLVGGCINGQIVIWDLTKKLENVEKIEHLSETRERYRIAMQHHMTWMKDVFDKTVLPPTALTNLQTSHYGAVTSIHWLSPKFTVTPTGKTVKLERGKIGQIFLTGSEDGTILIWNLSVENYALFEVGKIKKKSKRVTKRPSALMVDVSPYKILDRTLQPSYKIVLGIAGKPRIYPLQCFGISKPQLKFHLNPLIKGTGRTYFTCEIPEDTFDMSKNMYCGTNHGDLLKFTWEGHEFNTGEVVNSEYSEIAYKCTIHDGIITRVEKNPFDSEICASVGGKIFAIWSEKLLNKPLIWKKRNCALTDCKWSLYKPSLLFISTTDGDLETWDLLLRSDKPVAVQTVSGSMLTGVTIHTLPLKKDMIGVSDVNGSFRLFLIPPIFMLRSSAYLTRMENMVQRELTVMLSFNKWQDEWIKNNPHIVLDIQQKEADAIVAKEEEKKRLREEEERKFEQEAEARKIARAMVIGPEERWQKIVQKLIERTIAVKKRINRAELIEQEKPLRELEAQRLEKERRMLEIMKNQKAIFDNTVSILFPEAVKKPEVAKKSLLSDNKEVMKKDFLKDYNIMKIASQKTVTKNPYQVEFSWDATLAEGKERREALNTFEAYINLHRSRLEDVVAMVKPVQSKTSRVSDDFEVPDTRDSENVDEIPSNAFLGT